jgi:DNA-binding LytR/AlgR family response regulator
LDFLIKPLTEEKVIETLEKFIHLNDVKKNVFYFHVGKSVCQLFLADIRYFACNGKKIEIHTRTGMDEFYGNMQEVMEQIEGKGFWVIHKSYIVNSIYVKVYHYDSVQMTDDTVLPISQKYRKAMKDNLLEICRKG